MKKAGRVLAYLLMAVLIFQMPGITGLVRAAAEEPVITETAVTPVVKEAPEVTVTPSVTEAPEVTVTPAAAEAPEVTVTPAAAEAPEVTETPAAAETPEVTVTPAAAEAPEVTVTPAAAEAPEVTVTPAVTETPEAAVTPEPTGMPEATVIPEPTEIPEETAAPAVTITPALTGAPAEPEEELAAEEETETVEIQSLNDSPGQEFCLNCGENPRSTWVKSTKLLLENQSGKLTAAEDLETIPEYAAFKFILGIQTENGTSISPQDKIVYQLPGWMDAGFVSGTITMGTKETGTWSAAGGKLFLQFENSYLESCSFVNIAAEVTLEGMVDTESFKEEGVITIQGFGAEKTLTVVSRENGVANIEITKQRTGIQNQGSAGVTEIASASYAIEVFAGSSEPEAGANNRDILDMVVTDEFTTEEAYEHKAAPFRAENSSLKGFLSYENIVCASNKFGKRTVRAEENATGNMEFRLDKEDHNGRLVPGERLTITYNLKVDSGMYTSDPRGVETGGTNTVPTYGDNRNTGADGGPRSWVARYVNGSAEVQGMPAGGKEQDLLRQNAAPRLEDALTLEKTWLWKGQDIDKEDNRLKHYRIRVNENPIMNINGWTLTDDLSSYQQVLASPVKVQWEDAQGQRGEETISLEDSRITKDEAGAPAGFVLTLEGTRLYTVSFDGRWAGSESADRILSGNSALLRAPEQEYGVHIHLEFPAATVTKQSMDADFGSKTIRWQTTVDRGIDIQAGDIYQDWTSRFYRVDGKGDTYSEVSTDHCFTQELLGEVRVYQGKEKVPVSQDAYTVSLLEKLTDISPEEQKRWLGGMQIVFHEDMEGPVYIQYKTSADFSTVTQRMTGIADPGTIRTEFRNSGRLLSGNGQKGYVDAAYAYVEQGMLSKYGEWKGDSQAEAEWFLKVNFEKHPNGTVIIRDCIPEGLEFIEARIDEAWRKTEDGGQERVDGTERFQEGEQYVVSFDENQKALTVTFPELGETYARIKVRTRPSAALLVQSQRDEDGVTLTNKAQMYTGDTDRAPFMEASASVNFKYSLLGKEYLYDVKSAPFAEYRIPVNPGGVQLCSEEGKLLTLTDRITGDKMLLAPDSIAVKNSRTHVQLKTGEDYRQQITAEGFVLALPDATPLEITYRVFLQGKEGASVSPSNEASLSWEEMQIGVTNEKENETVVAYAHSQSPKMLTIQKTEAGNPEKRVAGAVYEIRTYDISTGKAGESPIGQPAVTDETGTAVVGNEYGLEKETVYCFAETKAPEGYLLDKTRHPFVFYDDDTTDEYLAKITENCPEIAKIYLNFNLPVHTEDEKVETMDLPVAKKWNDGSNAEGNRPESITAALYADIQDGNGFQDTGKRLVLAGNSENPEKNWKGIFEAIPVTTSDAAVEITYKVEEIRPEGVFPYEVTVDGSSDRASEKFGFVIANHELTDISGTKVWDDGENQDGIRPESISVMLLADGKEAEEKTVTCKEADEQGRWHWSFTGMRKYDDNGREILYTMKEKEVKGYKTFYSWNGLEITNIHIPEKKPAPTEPAPTEPAPTEPAPTEPALAEPTPTPSALAGSIRVTKKLQVLGFSGELFASDAVYYTALFEDAEGLKRCSEVKALHMVSNASAEAVFDKLPDGIYYVFETTADGTAIPYGTAAEDAEGQAFTPTARGAGNRAELAAQAGKTECRVSILNTYAELPEGFYYRENPTPTKKPSPTETITPSPTETLAPTQALSPTGPASGSGTTPGQNVKTGDTTPVLPLLLLLLASFAVITAAIRKRRRG